LTAKRKEKVFRGGSKEKKFHAKMPMFFGPPCNSLQKNLLPPLSQRANLSFNRLGALLFVCFPDVNTPSAIVQHAFSGHHDNPQRDKKSVVEFLPRVKLQRLISV
jgi:hypothetical protein